MTSELTDVNETRKNLKIEVPSEVVDAEIERIAKDYSRKARIPGFRPGKAPARVIRQRFKDQILHDVAHGLVPRAVDEALRERGLEPVDTPDVVDVSLEEGQAMTFTASFDTVPAFDIGDYNGLMLTRPSVHVDDAAVDEALERLRGRAARFEPVEGRGIIDGDIATIDLEQTDAEGKVERRTDVTVELGGKSNPPGFDEQVAGLEPGATKSFTIHYPADYQAAELADKDLSFTITVKTLRRRVLPELDDDFAKDLGEFDTLDALRARMRHDIEHEAGHTAEHAVRNDLMKLLAARVTFEVPASLVERELDRRVEDFAGRLMDQGVDPRQANIDWQALRESQRNSAKEAVASSIALDEVSRREQIQVLESDVDKEIARYAERTGRTPAAVRASIEKEGGLSRIYTGLRREKSIDFLMAHATIAQQ